MSLSGDTLSSADLLEHFRLDHARAHATDINLTIRPEYLDLLAKLGDPHTHCPPVFHVAGTNGKGSTCAFLRAILEAAGYKVHVYTSPHLVRFHERIRVAGELIAEPYLVELLRECRDASTTGSISYFEAATAVAFAAFARNKADFTILETGLGGRLDATNVVPRPLTNIITRLSYDHREYLGDTLAQIAREKAGIMRAGVPCFVAAQPEREAIDALRDAAHEKNTTLHIGGIDWTATAKTGTNAGGFHFRDATRDADLPQPILLGGHQIGNAGLAIAALAAVPQALSLDAIKQGLCRAEWPARLQSLAAGKLVSAAPRGTEIWLDGGHNDSAGEVLAQQAAAWRAQDGVAPKSLHLIMGMLTTKMPREFLSPLLPFIDRLTTVAIPGEPQSFGAEDLAQQAEDLGLKNVARATSVEEALHQASASSRILICGSLYLAGHVLALNEKT